MSYRDNTATIVDLSDKGVSYDVVNYLKKKYGVEYIDVVEGMARKRSLLIKEESKIENVKISILDSVKLLGSRIIAVIIPGRGEDKKKKKNLVKLKYDTIRLINSWAPGVSMIIALIVSDGKIIMF